MRPSLREPLKAGSGSNWFSGAKTPLLCSSGHCHAAKPDQDMLRCSGSSMSHGGSTCAGQIIPRASFDDYFRSVPLRRGPLKYVSGHVVNTVRAFARWEAINRRRRTDPVATIEIGWLPVVSPWKNSALRSPGRLFPFIFGRQSIFCPKLRSRPRAICRGIAETH